MRLREVSLPSGTARRKWTPTAIRSAGTKVATKRAPWPVLPDEVSPISAAASTTAPNRAARATRRPRRSRPGRTRRHTPAAAHPTVSSKRMASAGGDPSPGSSRRGRLGQTERRQDQGRHHQQNASGGAGLVRSRAGPSARTGPGRGGRPPVPRVRSRRFRHRPLLRLRIRPRSGATRRVPPGWSPPPDGRRQTRRFRPWTTATPPQEWWSSDLG